MLGFVYHFNWKCFGDHFFFMILWQIFSSDQSTPTNQILSLFGICCFIFWNCRETRSHFESRPKTVNIHGYSELREPVGTRKNCYPLIWWILIRYITTIVKSNVMQSLKDVFKTWCSFAFDIFVFRVTIFYDWSIFKL